MITLELAGILPLDPRLFLVGPIRKSVNRGLDLGKGEVIIDQAKPKLPSS